MGIIERDQQALLAGRKREQAQHRGADCELLVDRGAVTGDHRLERPALPLGKLHNLTRQGSEQVMKSGERQLRLDRMTGCAKDPSLVQHASDRVQNGGLADTRITGQQDPDGAGRRLGQRVANTSQDVIAADEIADVLSRFHGAYGFPDVSVTCPRSYSRVSPQTLRGASFQA